MNPLHILTPEEKADIEACLPTPELAEILRKEILDVCLLSTQEVQRPSLYCEEVAQEDGTHQLDRRECWSAITFKSDVDPFDFTQSFERVTLTVNPNETWRFYNARIALLPGSSISPGHFVMIFEKCERIVPSCG